ncbi:MAG: hypothetical protein ACO26Y_00550 [Burkholderiaceae bacterium]
MRAISGCGALLVALLISGCATTAIDSRERLQLERADETLVMVTTGRFVIRAAARTPTDAAPLVERGAQGQFEWREYRSAATMATTTREVVIWRGPLGQSAGSIEMVRGVSSTFDDQGRRLDHQDQLRFLRALLGDEAAPAMNDPQITAALNRLMAFFHEALAERDGSRGVHQTTLDFGRTIVSLRIAVDAP